MTTNNVVVANIAPGSTGASPDLITGIWYLTRALKKAGWKYRASGDGTATKDILSSDANTDLWGGFSGASLVKSGTDALVFEKPTQNRRTTVTGLSGINSLDKGRFLYISGSSGSDGYHQIEEIVSSTSVKLDNYNYLDTTEGDAIPVWQIHDPVSGSQPTLTGSAWWYAAGPSSLKMVVQDALTTGSYGSTFIRGENIFQQETGFEGELLSLAYDGTLTGSYAVVLPRIRGSSTGSYGIASPGYFTGSISGAVFYQTGSLKEFLNEVVVWKSSGTNSTGRVWANVYDTATTGSFGFNAIQAGCTATTAPGGGGTGNAFQAQMSVIVGGAANAVHDWSTSVGDNPFGRCHVMVGDAIPESWQSADGTWLFIVAGGLTNQNATLYGFGQMRMDMTEVGDLHPYVDVVRESGSPSTTGTRTGHTQAGASTSTPFDPYFSLTTNTYYRGWRFLDVSSATYTDYTAAYISPQGSTTAIFDTNLIDLQLNLHNFGMGREHIRDRIWLVNTTSGTKLSKGVMRWMTYSLDTMIGLKFDNGRLIGASNKWPGTVLGPWQNEQLKMVSV